jgi:hypothetical protein
LGDGELQALLGMKGTATSAEGSGAQSLASRDTGDGAFCRQVLEAVARLDGLPNGFDLALDLHLSDQGETFGQVGRFADQEEDLFLRAGR